MLQTASRCLGGKILRQTYFSSCTTGFRMKEKKEGFLILDNINDADFLLAA